jgi:two-component system sensor histidine kinase DesK
LRFFLAARAGNLKSKPVHPDLKYTPEEEAMPTIASHKEYAQSRWAWLWLAYVGFIFIDPILNPGLYLWLGTLASLAVFFLFFWGLFYKAETHAGRCWMIFATFILGIMTFPFNQGASTYLIYAAAFLPFTLKSMRRVVVFIALEIVAVIAEGIVFTVVAPHKGFYIGWANTGIAAFLILIIGGGNIYFAEQKRAEGKLRAALEENVTLAAVAERERIARDLHDVLGHTLSVIVLKAELAGRLVSIDPARAATEMGDVERTARSALAEIREAIGGYRSRGLAAEIEAARHTLDAASVKLLAEGSPSTGSLSPQEETALALALREAVTNIVRHAHATTCWLRFTEQSGLRSLEVEDDGPRAVIKEGNGLRGMRERIESLGGRFSLERSLGRSDTSGEGTQQPRGTRLILELPARKSLEGGGARRRCEQLPSQAELPHHEAAAS